MNQERIHDLLARYLDQSATPEETAELGERLACDETLRDQFWQEARFHALIRRSVQRAALGGQLNASDEQLTVDSAAVCQSPTASPFTPNNTESQKTKTSRPRPVAATPAQEATGFLRLAQRYSRDWYHFPLAAVVLLITTVLIYSAWTGSRNENGIFGDPPIAESPGNNVADPPVVARLVNTLEAKWVDRTPDSDVAAGPLRLADGTAQLVTTSGAVVDLLGPTELHLVSDMKARCGIGLLSLYVPESAHGFTVDAGNFEIVDLGTRCNLAIESDGEAHVEVTEGSVELREHGRLLRVVEAGEVMSRSPGQPWQFRDSSESLLAGDELAMNLMADAEHETELPDFDAVDLIFSVDYEDGSAASAPGLRTKPPAEDSILVVDHVSRSGRRAVRHQVRRGQFRASSDNMAMPERSRYSEGDYVQYRFSIYRPEDSGPGRLGVWSFKRFVGPADQIIVLDEGLEGFGMTLLERFPRATWVDVVLRVKWGHEKEVGWVKAYTRSADGEEFTLRSVSVGPNMRNARPKAAYCIWGVTRPNFKRGKADAVWRVCHDDISVGVFEPTAEEIELENNHDPSVKSRNERL